VVDEKEFYKLANRMVNAARRLYNRDILSGVGGNISIRTSNPDHIILSPSGIPVADMFPDDLCLVDISGVEQDKFKVIKAKYKFTSEIYLHSKVYKNRSEIKAIIHSHPPIITAYACTNKEINFKILEDQRWYIGDVEYLSFVSSSTKELAEAAWPKLTKNYALILKNHGLITLGDSLCEAVNITELLEELAKVSYYALNIGEGKVMELPKEYWENCKIVPRNNLIYHDEIFD